MNHPKGTLVTLSHWPNGKVRFEHFEMKNYPAWITRTYSPNGTCLEDVSLF